MGTVYEAGGGEGGLPRLARARQVRLMADEVVSHAFSHGYRTRQVLHAYLEWATTTTLSRFQRSADDVPDDLLIAHRSWDGLAGNIAPAGSDPA